MHKVLKFKKRINHVEKKYIFLYFIKTFIYIKSFIYINQVYIDIIRIDIFIFQIGMCSNFFIMRVIQLLNILVKIYLSAILECEEV